mmetsp:Transcript_11607/g.27834  ORF Transcript_11607/g.27834 Transcript_11607/m.27834 type:complete len:389 (+) Transcript_11607:846-2012(+)
MLNIVILALGLLWLRHLIFQCPAAPLDALLQLCDLLGHLSGDGLEKLRALLQCEVASAKPCLFLVPVVLHLLHECFFIHLCLEVLLPQLLGTTRPQVAHELAFHKLQMIDEPLPVFSQSFRRLLGVRSQHQEFWQTIHERRHLVMGLLALPPQALFDVLAALHVEVWQWLRRGRLHLHDPKVRPASLRAEARQAPFLLLFNAIQGGSCCLPLALRLGLPVFDLRNFGLHLCNLLLKGVALFQEICRHFNGVRSLQLVLTLQIAKLRGDYSVAGVAFRLLEHLHGQGVEGVDFVGSLAPLDHLQGLFQGLEPHLDVLVLHLELRLLSCLSLDLLAKVSDCWRFLDASVNLLLLLSHGHHLRHQFGALPPSVFKHGFLLLCDDDLCITEE